MSLTSSLDSSWGSVGQERKKALSEDAKLLSHKQSILDETPKSQCLSIPYFIIMVVHNRQRSSKSLAIGFNGLRQYHKLCPSGRLLILKTVS